MSTSSSTRHQVIDAVIDALRDTSGVKYVSESFQHYEEVDKPKMPACFVIDTNEEHEAFAIGGGTDSIQCTLTVLITCYIYDAQDNTRETRTDLIRDINKSMLNDAALAALVLDIQPVSVQTDQGMIENYSLFNMEYEVMYLYNRSLGG